MTQYLVMTLFKDDRFPPKTEIFVEHEGDTPPSVGYSLGIGDGVPSFYGPYDTYEEAQGEADEYLLRDSSDLEREEGEPVAMAWVFPMEGRIASAFVVPDAEPFPE